MQAPASRRLVGTVPNGAAGIIHSPDGRAVLVVNNVEPALMVIDTSADTWCGAYP